MIGDDLVNSYHLLLCCLDLIFANALLCPYKKDLLNPSFKGMFLVYPPTKIKYFRVVFELDFYQEPPLFF